MSRSLPTSRAVMKLSRQALSVRSLHSSRAAQTHYMFPDNQTFTKVVKESNRPTMIQFTATWCQPCKMLGPVLQRVTGGPDGTAVDLVVVDVDESPDLAGEYKVSAVPFVIGMKDGKVVDKFVGYQPEAKIKDFMAKLQ